MPRHTHATRPPRRRSSRPSTALAVGTSHWTHTSEADFKNGTFTHVVATNLGDLKLSRAVKTLLEQDAKVSAVYALVEAAGRHDLRRHRAAGRRSEDQGRQGHRSAEARRRHDRLLPRARRRRQPAHRHRRREGPRAQARRKSDDAKPKELFSGEGVQYVWSIVRTTDGKLYAATGPEGQLFEIKPDGGYVDAARHRREQPAVADQRRQGFALRRHRSERPGVPREPQDEGRLHRPRRGRGGSDARWRSTRRATSTPAPPRRCRRKARRRARRRDGADRPAGGRHERRADPDAADRRTQAAGASGSRIPGSPIRSRRR